MSGERWWLARCYWSDATGLRLMLDLGWEPFSAYGRDGIYLRKFSQYVPHEQVERQWMVPGT